VKSDHSVHQPGRSTTEWGEDCACKRGHSGGSGQQPRQKAFDAKRKGGDSAGRKKRGAQVKRGAQKMGSTLGPRRVSAEGVADRGSQGSGSLRSWGKHHPRLGSDRGGDKPESKLNTQAARER